MSPHGRAAAIGDALASLLDWVGYRVEQEYVNDAGSQMRFGRSVEALPPALGQDVRVPDDGYPGGLRDRPGTAHPGARRGCPRRQGGPSVWRRSPGWDEEEMLREHQETLRNFGVHFDVWWHRGLAARERQGERGHRGKPCGSADTCDAEERGLAALDRVRRRQGPPARSQQWREPTYIAADLAYHRDKFERGFAKVIDIWGPDHHGYIARTKAGVQALGFSADQLDILITSSCASTWAAKLPRRLEARAGDIIPLDEVIAEVGKDTARYFYLMRTANSPLDFDLDLAEEGGGLTIRLLRPVCPRADLQHLRGRRNGQIPIPEAQTTDLTLLTADPERC